MSNEIFVSTTDTKGRLSHLINEDVGPIPSKPAPISPELLMSMSRIERRRIGKIIGAKIPGSTAPYVRPRRR